MPPAARRLSTGYRQRDNADRPAPLSVLPPGAPFVAELDLAELDDRFRPGPRWTGRGHELSRSHLVLRSKRMCYDGRSLVVLVHLVDDRPVSLFGRVTECEYDADGLYKTRIELAVMPDAPELAAWLRARDARGILYPPPG